MRTKANDTPFFAKNGVSRDNSNPYAQKVYISASVRKKTGHRRTKDLLYARRPERTPKHTWLEQSNILKTKILRNKKYFDASVVFALSCDDNLAADTVRGKTSAAYAGHGTRCLFV